MQQHRKLTISMFLLFHATTNGISRITHWVSEEQKGLHIANPKTDVWLAVFTQSAKL
jgi:hypothetical protein